jgi:alkylated DNA repair dioxygenase AlkB
MARPAPAHHAAVQQVLLDVGDDARIAARTDAPQTERIDLGTGAWIDVQRQFLAGADLLFRHLVDHTPWKHERRTMYGRQLDVPRLTKFLEADETWPHPALRELNAALSDRYRAVQPHGFATVGMCLYRDGADSVAWHGDTFGRGATDDVLVAIVSLGAPRALAVRRRGGGRSQRWTLDSGDLLVMGGSCQRTFEHAIPKTTRPVGPRISLQFRPIDVR